MTAESEFLSFSVAKLLQLMGRIETCVEKLNPDQLWKRGGDNQNAVGNLLLHLNGNVRQWILHGVGGQPDQRERDAEFAAQSGTGPDAGRAKLLADLRATVMQVIDVIRTLPPARLTESIHPQGYDVTVLTAIYTAVEHFSGHAFQIILLTKLFTGEDLGFYAHLTSSVPRRDPLP
jgi:Protein of unknown function (DUF1572)